MNLIQDCVNTFKRVGSEIRESLQATQVDFQQAQASNTCGCGQEVCRLGNDGCKPTAQPITVQEEGA
jgi:hypothetical protein